MTTTPGPTLIDTKDTALAIRRRQERVAHIDAQIAELEDKKGIILHEIDEMKRE